MENKETNLNKINNNPYINKIFKFVTKEKREIIGNLKAYNKEGNFYLIDCVEVFNKKSEHYATNELFENHVEHKFYYETDDYQYQYINNCVFPLEEIGDIFMLKEDIFNNYKKLLDDYYKEMREKKMIEEEQKKEEENNENINNNNNNENKIEDNNNNENIEDILDSLNKEEKKKEKKEKEKKIKK